MREREWRGAECKFNRKGKGRGCKFINGKGKGCKFISVSFSLFINGTFNSTMTCNTLSKEDNAEYSIPVLVHNDIHRVDPHVCLYLEKESLYHPLNWCSTHSVLP